MAQLPPKFSFPSFFPKKIVKLDPVDTPKGFVNLARKCMERVQRLTFTLKFNYEQCRYLAEKLNLVVEYACSFLEALNSQPVEPQKDVVDCLEVFKLLYALAMEVENIIRSCCRDPWTLAAVTLTDMSEHISSLGFDLELWRLVVYQQKTPAAVDHIFRAEVEVVKKKASVDKETLMRDTQALLKRTELSDIEHQRASLLLQRLDRSVGSSQSSRSETMKSSLEEMESLGKGSASTVYRAMWLGAEFAKKTFYGPNFPDFEKEVSILTGLSHPYIAPLICYGKDKRECSIVMELMDGDLFTLIQRRLKADKARDSPFGLLEAVDIMHQIAEGMQFLHERKIVHRDLKSMNVLVKCVKSSESKVEYVQIKVADFGLSRTKERSTTYSNQTVNVGTTRWMAPEIICVDSGSEGNGEDLVVQYPFKCDVYSFGMVCYEILSGDIPFSNISSPTEVKKMMLDGEHPELPTRCPELLKNLIERCWSLDPSQRCKFGDICADLRHLKFQLLCKPFVFSNIRRPLTRSLQAWDSTPCGSSEGGSSSLGKRIIFDWRITANMLAFLDKEDALASCLVVGGLRGWTYRVRLQDDLVVAIKCVCNLDHFALSYFWFRHRNLVPLLAYVFRRDCHYFVYEFVPGGSLQDALNQMAARKLTLSWPQRHRILCGVAQGLAALHDGSLGRSFMHCNLKAANILLDEGYDARIGHWHTIVEPHIPTYVFADPFGVHAPECLRGGRCSQESDVYSYGIVIAQLVTGDSRADRALYTIPQHPLWLFISCDLPQGGGFMQSIDPALQGSGYEDEILRAMQVAESCTQWDPERRPTSSEALKMLLRIRKPDTTTNSTPSHSYAQISGHRFRE